jgi:hypothetical protein
MSADGCPIWIDLACDDIEVSKKFYAEVLGWDFAAPEDGAFGWTMALADGVAVAGLAPRREGTPATWSIYLATTNSDATLAGVADLGGQVLVPAFDITINNTHMGRISAAADPTGGAFGLWEPDAMLGMQPTGAPGHPVWFELNSTNPVVATSFYAQLFTASTEEMADPGGYHAVVIDGEQRFGVWGMPGLLPDENESRWFVYLSVRDVDAAAVRVQSIGGAVHQIADSPHGRWAYVSDPQGAEFYLLDVTAKS